MSLKKKLQNVPPSWRALKLLWSEELSFRVLAICGAVVIGLAYFFGVTQSEFLILILVIGAVLAVEALNTALEELCDHVTPEEHPHIGRVKDLGSGATLLMIIAALATGLIIFVPYVLPLI
ncbi:MAG: diacylglycerol kinase [Patescibacteria group bacterium]